eukprot:Skav207966  [mRNA]  locus=scaffold495:25268:25693:- [translate_table: standard]
MPGSSSSQSPSKYRFIFMVLGTMSSSSFPKVWESPACESLVGSNSWKVISPSLFWDFCANARKGLLKLIVNIFFDSSATTSSMSRAMEASSPLAWILSRPGMLHVGSSSGSDSSSKNEKAPNSLSLRFLFFFTCFFPAIFW